jgi:recombinational DNA repair protein (RecF pathway)
MPLDTREARKLTSREIAKLVAGIMTGLIDWCGSKAVCEALNHFVEHQKNYERTFRHVEEVLKMEVALKEKNKYR